LIARNAETLQKTADELSKDGGEAAAFPIESYDFASVKGAFDAIKSKWPNQPIRGALYNSAHGVWKPFLDVTEDDFKENLKVNAEGAFSFARESILAFKQNEVDEKGKRGILIFTGATASVRGNVVTSSFATGKHALRALSQSLAKEFGKENIHVAHAIIDGGILTDRTLAMGRHKVDEPDTRLSPESIANAYLYLANQDRSAWTWELDLRPAHEKW